MALRKVVMTEYGYEASHWRITRFENNIEQKTITAHMVGYKDRAHFLSGGKPMIPAVATIVQPQWKKNMSVAEMETVIKSTSEWSDAVDDQE